jgi:rhamnosyltransferase
VLSFKTVAVVVAYESKIQILEESLKTISKQCVVVLVDNSTSNTNSKLIKECAEKYKSEYISMGKNCGIGYAQNRGIELAISRGADAVLLLDDDSVPEESLVENLVACSKSFGLDCVISSNAKDELGQEISNVRYTRKTVVKCRDMMSSGTLIPTKIYKNVGKFNEEMFIDCVDFEWGWRAQKLGIKIFVCKTTSIKHRLGSGLVLGLKYPAPLRHYYQYRNITRLVFGTSAPIMWRFAQVIKLLLKPAIIILLFSKKRERLKYIILGIKDAAAKKTGRFESKAQS